MRTLHITAIKKAITAHFATKNAESIAAGIKPRLALTEKLQNEMIQAVEYIIAPQIIEHLNLNLNDEAFAELEITPRRGKQIREELREAGIIFMVKETRPKKKGDYPLYLVREGFIKFPKIEKAEKKQWVPSTSNKYNSTYCKIKDTARKNVAAFVATQDRNYSGNEFSIMVNIEINMILASMGIEKVDLVK